ncbi:hypothetical protein EW053_19865 [Streptomyces sp. IB2014 016-6]|nr:hypothetical protein EW053_19865 [Streptomyces sp. IB2014 016-6]
MISISVSVMQSHSTEATGGTALALRNITRCDLGLVFELASGSRRLARTPAALSDLPKYTRYESGPPSCDRTHRTP